MAKDAYYFSHDSNAKDDPKCVMLIEQLGLEGYGIYWVLIEMLRDQPEYKYPLSLIPAISRRYNTTSEKMKTVIGNYGLFTVDDNDFFSLALIKRMGFYEYKREIARAAGKKSAQVRALNSGSTDVQPTFNGGSTSKVNVSTVDVSRADILSTLKKIDGYPSDSVADLKMLDVLQERYPTIDILESIKDWSINKLSNPLKSNSNPRSQINTWVGNAFKWGKNLKQVDKPIVNGLMAASSAGVRRVE
jgi:hypothetical protein